MPQCQDIMIVSPACCLADDGVYEIAQRMQDEDVDYFVVVESHNKKLMIGIVTDNDIVRKIVAVQRDVTKMYVRDIMSQNPLFCYSSDGIEKTLERMEHHQIRRFPVLNAKREVLGIIIQARTIRARVSVRMSSEYQITATTIKQDFDGWADMVQRLPVVVRQVVSTDRLTESLNTQYKDLGTAASSA